jgi:hypothetical protein
MVTPMAQVVELAKSERSLETKVNKRMSPTTKRKAHKKNVANNKKIQPEDAFT